MNWYDASVRAPEFPVDAIWVNSDPVKLAALRGRFVILDFWTFG